MGRLEGLSWGAAEARFGDQIGVLLVDWFHTIPPDGEPPTHMLERVGRCVDELIQRGEDTLMVAHNGSLSLVLLHLGLAEERDMFQRGWTFRHGCYSAIRVDQNGPELIHFNR